MHPPGCVALRDLGRSSDIVLLPVAVCVLVLLAAGAVFALVFVRMLQIWRHTPTLRRDVEAAGKRRANDKGGHGNPVIGDVYVAAPSVTRELQRLHAVGALAGCYTISTYAAATARGATLIALAAPAFSLCLLLLLSVRHVIAGFATGTVAGDALTAIAALLFLFVGVVQIWPPDDTRGAPSRGFNVLLSGSFDQRGAKGRFATHVLHLWAVGAAALCLHAATLLRAVEQSDASSVFTAYAAAQFLAMGLCGVAVAAVWLQRPYVIGPHIPAFLAAYGLELVFVAALMIAAIHAALADLDDCVPFTEGARRSATAAAALLLVVIGPCVAAMDRKCTVR